MITSSQRTQACILLNKLKLLINEAAYVYDLKTLYTAIESGIDTTSAEAVNAAMAAAGGGAAAGGADTGADPAGSAAVPVSLTPCISISTTWLETKITELKTEITLTLTEIETQIRKNI